MSKVMKKSRKKINKYENRICEMCKEQFAPKREWQRFCSNECRQEKWNYDNPRVKREELLEMVVFK